MTEQPTENYIDTPVCIDKYGDGVYKRTYLNGEWDAIEKHGNTVIP